MTTKNELSPELLREIRQLHIETKRLANAAVSGEYKSAFKGLGIEFEEVREYCPGDDIRTIDWKVMARAGKPFVKRYREERELSVLVAVDISASTETGSRVMLRSELIARVSAILTLIALINNDKIGLVLFDSDLRHFSAPKKARSAVWRALHQILIPREDLGATNLKNSISKIYSLLKTRSVIFLISDFLDGNYQKELSILARKHDVTAIRVLDNLDLNPLRSGLINVFEPEKRKSSLVDFSSSSIRKKYKENLAIHEQNFKNIIKAAKLDYIELKTDEPYMQVLRKYFYTRKQRQIHGF